MKSVRAVGIGILIALNCGVGFAYQQQGPASTGADNQATAAAVQEKPAAATTPVSERQKKLAADTDKLLALATDLKKQVDRTNKDILSIEVVKKADEIEKLARSMKNDMK